MSFGRGPSFEPGLGFAAEPSVNLLSPPHVRPHFTLSTIQELDQKRFDVCEARCDVQGFLGFRKGRFWGDLEPAPI